MKTPLYVCVHIKTIPWKFRILNPTTSRVTKGTVQKYSEETLFWKFAANLQQNTPWWRDHAEVQFQYKVASKFIEIAVGHGCFPVNLCIFSEHLFLRTSLDVCFMSYLPVKCINFLKRRLIFNIFYCFSLFVNKLFTYLTCACLKK